jgi:hypothetical protein
MKTWVAAIKHKIIPALLLIIAIGLLVTVLTSCQLGQGLRQTDPNLVPAIISQVVPDGPQRTKAMMRWDYAVKVPRDFLLVDVIGAQINLTLTQIDAAWPEILAL